MELFNSSDPAELAKEIPCLECGRIPVYKASSEHVYRGRNYGPIWECECGARVGSHRGILAPLGRPAGQETRDLRIKAHGVVDKIWREGGHDRESIYKFMRNNVTSWDKSREIHIGECNSTQCLEIIEVMSKYAEYFAAAEKKRPKISDLRGGVDGSGKPLISLPAGDLAVSRTITPTHCSSVGEVVSAISDVPRTEQFKIPETGIPISDEAISAIGMAMEVGDLFDKFAMKCGELTKLVESIQDPEISERVKRAVRALFNGIELEAIEMMESKTLADELRRRGGYVVQEKYEVDVIDIDR